MVYVQVMGIGNWGFRFCFQGHHNEVRDSGLRDLNIIQSLALFRVILAFIDSMFRITRVFRFNDFRLSVKLSETPSVSRLR